MGLVWNMTDKALFDYARFDYARFDVYVPKFDEAVMKLKKAT
jgi:hypothetical protein